MKQDRLFEDLMHEAIVYRERIKFRWGTFTASVKPIDEDLCWFIRYGNHSITFVSHPDDDESDNVYTQFISFIVDASNGEEN